MIYDDGYIVKFEDNTEALISDFGRPPFVTSFTHLVADGETLFDISKKYYKNTINWYLIAEANDLEDFLDIAIGDSLNIPEWF